MKLIFVFLITFACALSSPEYQSSLYEDVQAAFYEEAERAYRDIIAYDENAPVTRDEIYRLYRRDALFAPAKKAILNLFDTAPKTAKEYAERCVYEGRILANPPEGVVFVRAHLLPFTPSQAGIYDEIQKSGDLQALDALFSPLEDRVSACGGTFLPDNGFQPYFKMQAGDDVIPCAEGVLFLTQEALADALGLTKENPFSPPVRDARGVIVFEFVSG